MMPGEAEESIEQLERLMTLSRALTKGGLIVYRCRFDYLTFGSWTVEAGTAHRRLQISNDGREGLRYSTAILLSQSSPPQWEDRGRISVDESTPGAWEAWVASLAGPKLKV